MKKCTVSAFLVLSLMVAGCSSNAQQTKGADEGQLNTQNSGQNTQRQQRADITGIVKSINGNEVILTVREIPTPEASPQGTMTQEERDQRRFAMQNAPTKDVTVTLSDTVTVGKQQGRAFAQGGGGQGQRGQGQQGQQGQRGQGQQGQGQQAQQNQPQQMLASVADLQVGQNVQVWLDTDKKTAKKVVIVLVSTTPTAQQ
ncbi:MAG: hypothetical protein WCP97_08380 [bacterium]